jgi:hypothetical protein
MWSSGQSSWLQKEEVLCFLWSTNWIYICYVEESRPPVWSGGQSSWLQNGDVLCFLWGTNWIYICYVHESRQPVWSSGQSSWLQIQRSGFDSQRYHIFWEIVGLERGPLSPLSIIEGLLDRKSRGSGLENREYSHTDPSRWPRGTIYPQNVGTNFAVKHRSLGRYSLWPYGSAVVEALFYNLEGCGFETRRGEWIFFNLPLLSCRTRALVFTQPLTEICTGSI